MASSKKPLFQRQSKQWFNIVSTFIRILLIITMIFSIDSDEKSTITYFTTVNALLCIILIGSMIISIVLETINAFV